MQVGKLGPLLIIIRANALSGLAVWQTLRTLNLSKSSSSSAEQKCELQPLHSVVRITLENPQLSGWHVVSVHDRRHSWALCKFR